jgi:capsular polysaccharide biosynthesis protein
MNFVHFAIFISLQIYALEQPKNFISLEECKHNALIKKYLLEEQDIPQFVLELENSTVVREGGIITADNKILSATQVYKSDEHGILNGPWNSLIENHVYFNATLAVISSPGQQCYYHWLLQILPRLKVLKDSVLEYDKIYLYGENFKHKWQKETLYAVMDFLKIPHDALYISPHAMVTAKKLVVPSVPWNPANPYYWDVMGVMAWYKQFFNDVFIQKSSAITPKRVFISRAKANYRRIANENDLMQVLSKKNFISYRLEELSIFDQAALFNNAEVIIGPHGAGWANLIFCKQGTKIVEIDHGLKGEDQRSSFKGMTKRLGCIYYPFYVDLLDATDSPEDILAPINQDLSVDIEEFAKYIEKLSI